MREERFRKKIEERWAGDHYRSSHSRIWTGLFLLVIGGLLLLKTANLIIFPAWFFTWPMLLIAIGIFSALRHGFRQPFWVIMIVVGAIFLAGRIDPELRMEKFIWPIILIAVGISFIFRPRRKRWESCSYNANKSRHLTQNVSEATDQPASETDFSTVDRSDFLDVTSVFGGVKKNVLSKNFKGGDIVSFMGGSEIDLTQADFSGKIIIDTTNIFGGTKLIVPSSWDVQNDITAVFGGVDDKRQIQGVTMDPNKVLVLDGTCLFGGIEIRSY